MSNNNIVDVGTPPDGIIDDWTTTVVRFHGYSDLSTTRGECVTSPEFLCFGHRWELQLYPGGISVSPEGYAAVSLVNMADTSIKVQWGYSVKDADGRAYL